MFYKCSPNRELLGKYMVSRGNMGDIENDNTGRWMTNYVNFFKKTVLCKCCIYYDTTSQLTICVQ